MRSSARPSASAETELVFGTLFHIHKFGRGWVWGQSESQVPGRAFPGYVGWVKTSRLGAIKPKPTHIVITRIAPVFSKANIKSPVATRLSMGSVVQGQPSGDFVETEQGFIHREHVRAISAKPDVDWVKIAEDFLECPYVWGGVSGFGLDCSGLVQTSLRMGGKDAPRDSDQQACMGRAINMNPDFADLCRGDLVFWKGHVGIMTSPTQLLHANAHHMRVAVEPLTQAADRIKKNADPITGIRRL